MCLPEYGVWGQHLAAIEDLLIKYMERKLILLYSLDHGNRPICNAG